MNQHHILSVLVKNQPGTLVRVASRFADRAFNIYSLVVAPTDDDAYSRLTVAVDTDGTPLDEIAGELRDMTDVVELTELPADTSVQRELLLVTVEPEHRERGYVSEVARVFNADILTTGTRAITVALHGAPHTLDRFAGLLKRFNIVEIQRTGPVALTDRGWPLQD